MKCQYIKADGEQCGNNAIPGSAYCHIKSHQPSEEELPEIINTRPEELLVAAPAADAPGVCGHINRHSYGINGELDNISCTLPAGHSGDHGAPHLERDYGEGGAVTWEGERWADWTDMAGTPADQLKPNESELVLKRFLRQLNIEPEDLMALLSNR